MPASAKPPIFEKIFRDRFDEQTKTLSNPLVTSVDIRSAIDALKPQSGKKLSVGNPANFMKDYLRLESRNEQWPKIIFDFGYTARQASGKKAVFEFIPLIDKDEPFPDNFVFPPADNRILQDVESISLPSAARALGEVDESWLTQVVVMQRVLQTHFALYSKQTAIDLFHLQNNRKAGSSTEIDAIFLLTTGDRLAPTTSLITFEAKRNDYIIGDQIRKQVAYVAGQAARRPELSNVKWIIPVAAATNTIRFGEGVVALFEMEPISIADGAAANVGSKFYDLPLTIIAKVGYTFKPPITGI